MKKILISIYRFITKPFVTIAINNKTDRMVKFLNKHSYIYFIIAFILTAGIIFLIYFLPYL
jgi:HKD family nuclease